MKTNVMWCPGWDPGTEKRLGKKYRNLNNVWTLINTNVSILAH